MHPTRRQALTAGAATGAAALAAACTNQGPRQPSPAVVNARIAIDAALKQAAITRERGLLRAYLAAQLALPELTATMAPLYDDHAAHLAALGGGLPPADASPVQGPRQTVLRGLAAEERTAAAAHAAATLTASRELAPLLASLAACEASHAVIL